MELRDYSTGDEHKIIELFENVFKQKMALEQWQWRFAKNPAGNLKIKLMWDKDTLVGHYAVSPIFLKINGKQVLTAHSLATMTHPDYGGRGVFKELSKALYDDLEQNQGFKAIWGYPNTNSHYGFVSKLGWKDIGVLHTMAVSADSFSPSSSKSIIELKNFDKSHEKLFNEKLANFEVWVDRNVDYLNWRFNLKPSVDYKIFQFNKDKPSLMVTKIYPSSKEGKWDLNIVELILQNIDELPDMINHALAAYSLDFDRVTIWKNVFDSEHIQFEKLGFAPGLPITYLGARMHSSIVSEMGDLKKWFISFGDSDVY